MFKLGPATNDDYPVVLAFYVEFLYTYNNQYSIISHRTLTHLSVNTA